MLNLFQHLLVIHTDPDPEYSGQGDNARFEIIQPLIRITNLNLQSPTGIYINLTKTLKIFLYQSFRRNDLFVKTGFILKIKLLRSDLKNIQYRPFGIIWHLEK